VSHIASLSPCGHLDLSHWVVKPVISPCHPHPSQPISCMWCWWHAREPACPTRMLVALIWADTDSFALRLISYRLGWADTPCVSERRNLPAPCITLSLPPSLCHGGMCRGQVVANYWHWLVGTGWDMSESTHHTEPVQLQRARAASCLHTWCVPLMCPGYCMRQAEKGVVNCRHLWKW